MNNAHDHGSATPCACSSDNVCGSFFDYAVAVEFQMAKHRGLPGPRHLCEDVSLHIKQLHGAACVP
jgi:hypothetical protein